jgi:hypothetical protein
MASHVLQHRTQYGSDCSTLRIDVQNPTLPAANKEQRALAVRLSHQTADEYKHDIVRHMHYMEVRPYKHETDFTRCSLDLVSNLACCQLR